MFPYRVTMTGEGIHPPYLELTIPYLCDDFYRQLWDGAGLWEAVHVKEAHTVLPGLEQAHRRLIQAEMGSIKYEAGFGVGVLAEWARQHPSAYFLVSRDTPAESEA